jgi:hypothetical protein
MNAKTRRPAPVPHGRLSNWALLMAVVAVGVTAIFLPGL